MKEMLGEKIMLSQNILKRWFEENNSVLRDTLDTKEWKIKGDSRSSG